MGVYVCIYIYMIFVYVFVYIYIYMIFVYVFVYIYIYMSDGLKFRLFKHV